VADHGISPGYSRDIGNAGHKANAAWRSSNAVMKWIKEIHFRDEMSRV
jgi:hypothetical protein